MAKRPSGKGCRDKGLAFERELITYIGEQLNIPLARGPAGAQAFDLSKGSSDIFGLPDLSVEAKRTERFLLKEFRQQAQRNANDDIPAVIHRFSRQPTGDASVVLSLDDFIQIYRAYLLLNGYVDE